MAKIHLIYEPSSVYVTKSIDHPNPLIKVSVVNVWE